MHCGHVVCPQSNASFLAKMPSFRQSLQIILFLSGTDSHFYSSLKHTCFTNISYFRLTSCFTTAFVLRTPPSSCIGCRSAHEYSTSCVYSFIGHWTDSNQTTSPSCYSLSPQDIQVCGQPTRTPCLSYGHHWSLGSGRSVLLVPQLGTAFRQTLRP